MIEILKENYAEDRGQKLGIFIVEQVVPSAKIFLFILTSQEGWVRN